MRVAVTQRIQQDGRWRDGDTSFLKVNVWRGQAEHLADSLANGDRVLVTGRLRQRSWETPRATSGRSPRSRPTRSAPPSSGPRPRWSGPAIGATTTALRGGSGRPRAAASSPTRRRFEQPFDAVSAPGFGRGRDVVTDRLAAGTASSVNLAFEAAPRAARSCWSRRRLWRRRRPRQHHDFPCIRGPGKRAPLRHERTVVFDPSEDCDRTESGSPWPRCLAVAIP
jgi:single-stranded DNA-binding protein